jgi:hypothetical protein
MITDVAERKPQSLIERLMADRPHLAAEAEKIRVCADQRDLQLAFDLLFKSAADRYLLLAVAYEKALAEGWHIDMSESLHRRLRSIVSGALEPALLSEKISPELRKRAERLSIRDQRRIASDALWKIAIAEDNHEAKHFSKMSPEELRQVIGDEGLREPEQQWAWKLEREAAARRAREAQTKYTFTDSPRVGVIFRMDTFADLATVEKIAEQLRARRR